MRTDLLRSCPVESDDNGVKLVDFGFASRLCDLTAKEVSMGTPVYVAPEIIRGDPYSAEVDMWSFGVICYIMLCGCPPFMHEDTFELFELILTGKLTFQEEQWKEVSAAAIDFVRHLLVVDQTNRWTAAQMLSHQWITMGEQASERRHMRTSQTRLSFNSSMLKQAHPMMEFNSAVVSRRRSVSVERPSAYSSLERGGDERYQRDRKGRFATTFL